MKKMMSLLTAFMLLLMNILPALAQSPAQLITLHPMNASVRMALEMWISASAPVDAPYFAETYIEQVGFDTFVSLAALNISTAEEPWSFTTEDGSPSKVIWVGSVKVSASGIVEPLFTVETPGGVSPRPRSAGGGDYVLFPFDAGTFVIFGPRGVHGSGDYGTSGMRAVDLVSGNDLGGSAASNAVYASDGGTVDYVCDDGTSVAIRTHNSSTGDYFIYAHLIDNSNLSMNHEFSQAEYIGSLKYGSFNDNCGWAEQASNHFHNHWMFSPSGGAFQAEGCILSVSSQKWDCGTKTISIGGELYGGGGAGVGAGQDDPGGTAGAVNREKGFWDYVLIGFVSIFDRGLLKLLPEHNSPTEVLLSMMNIVRVFFRLVWTLTRFNINLGPVMVLIVIVIGSKLIFGVIWLVFAVLRGMKAIPGL